MFYCVYGQMSEIKNYYYYYYYLLYVEIKAYVLFYLLITVLVYLCFIGITCFIRYTM